MASTEEAHRTDLMWGLIRAFGWMDRCLQENLAARGWQPLSRTESSIMLFVDQGTTSPVVIAQALGISLRTAQRDWMKARAWLKEELRSDASGADEP